MTYILFLEKEVISQPKTKNTLAVKKWPKTKKAGIKRDEIKTGGQGLCSATADQNKILITSQAAKH